MVKIQLVAGEFAAAVLADTLVSGIDVVPAKTDLPLRYAVITYQKDHSGNANNPIDKPYRLVTDGDRKDTPAIKIKGLILFIHCARNPLIKKGKCATY
jgi:hypothetical protein